MIDSVTCCLYSNILMFIQISCIIPMFLQITFKISSFTQDILNFRGEINGVHCKWSFLEQVFGMFFQYTCTFHVLAKKIRNIWSAMKRTVLKKSFLSFEFHQVEDCKRWIVASRSKLQLFEALAVGVDSPTIKGQVKRIYNYQEVVANTGNWISTVLKELMLIILFSEE